MNSPTSTNPAPTIALVHGAWADSSGWQGVISLLEREGLPVIALPNPLRGVGNDSDYVASALDTLSGPVVLVGHSYGGMIISNAAAKTRQANIQALVYIAGFIPDAGESALDLVSHTAPDMPGGSHIVPPGVPGVPANLTARPVSAAGGADLDLYINADAFEDVFAADVPSDQRRLMQITQRPLTLSAFQEPSGAVAWKTIPSWALVATQDNAIGFGNTRFMAERTVSEGKGHVTEIEAAHAAMVSQPQAVADLIRQAAAALATA